MFLCNFIYIISLYPHSRLTKSTKRVFFSLLWWVETEALCWGRGRCQAQQLKFWPRPCDFLFLIHFFYNIYRCHLEKAMAPHSSTLAWKIPWMEEPGGLQSMGSLRVRHDWATSLSLFTLMHWRRKWQPTLVFLPGESQGRGSLVGCRLWGRTESDTTEVT